MTPTLPADEFDVEAERIAMFLKTVDGGTFYASTCEAIASSLRTLIQRKVREHSEDILNLIWQTPIAEGSTISEWAKVLAQGISSLLPEKDGKIDLS